jgi:uncharacterized protein YhbP (UPF0306 family)
MSVERTSRRVSASRLVATTRRLLGASSLCAIATVSPGARAHVNTAYFAWRADFNVVWLSAPESRHSRNLRANPSVAIAVFDSRQSWDGLDRGIQLFGSAREVRGSPAFEVERLYAQRFRAYDRSALRAYRFYRFRPSRIKLFDERVLGGGVFVTAKVREAGRLEWERTERYDPED